MKTPDHLLIRRDDVRKREMLPRSDGGTESAPASRQWPDNICSGQIRYAAANNYDGFFLADAEHGIPTFGSVCPTATPTIRGQFVNVFNYPAQTEQIAAQLVHRWNSHHDLVKALEDILEANKDFRDGMPQSWDGDPLQDACDAAKTILDALSRDRTQGE